MSLVHDKGVVQAHFVAFKIGLKMAQIVYDLVVIASESERDSCPVITRKSCPKLWIWCIFKMLLKKPTMMMIIAIMCRTMAVMAHPYTVELLLELNPKSSNTMRKSNPVTTRSMKKWM